MIKALIFLGVMAIAAGIDGDQARPGLIGAKFHEADFRRPDTVETAEQINFDTGSKHNSYSSIWLGRIRIPVSKPVTFTAEADDGLTLTIGGREVISGWHDPQRAGSVSAEAGAVVPIELRHFQNGGTGHLRLFWSWEGHTGELIPASALTHTAADEARIRAIYSGMEKVEIPKPEPGGLSLLSNPEESASKAWSGGPWLMLDERNVLAVDHMRRVLGKPVRHGEPIVDGATDGNFQPYISVSRDTATGRWRMWYDLPRTPGNTAASSLALIESNDGIRWIRPHRVLETPPIQFGASVIDEGPEFSDRSKRFKAAWHHDNGLQVAVSPDGVAWRSLAPGPVLRHSHDIDAIDWDPIRRRYMAFVSFAEKLDPAWPEPRRIPHMSVSDDLVTWRKPWPIMVPDTASPYEQGETQFYCMAGVIARGDLLIGLVKILRDDLNAEPGLTARDLGDSRPFAGIGYTVLAWSADGVHWRRDREPFLDRNPQPGTWDRAHAWADEQVVHGDELFLYYGGYRLGHKAERLTTRQIGLARSKVDRYAGFEASGEHYGHFTTPVRPWNGSSLTVNADVKGELRVALCEPGGKFLPGFSFEDCEPSKGDSVAHAIRWNEADPSKLRDRKVQLVFRVRQGTVYAFSLGP